MANALKIEHFSFSSFTKCQLALGLKMHGRIANREDPDQTASKEAV